MIFESQDFKLMGQERLVDHHHVAPLHPHRSIIFPANEHGLTLGICLRADKSSITASLPRPDQKNSPDRSRGSLYDLRRNRSEPAEKLLVAVGDFRPGFHRADFTSNSPAAGK